MAQETAPNEIKEIKETKDIKEAQEVQEVQESQESQEITLDAQLKTITDKLRVLEGAVETLDAVLGNLIAHEQPMIREVSAQEYLELMKHVHAYAKNARNQLQKVIDAEEAK